MDGQKVFKNAIVRMPFVLMLFGATGLRAALLLPQDSRANWIFRMSDEDGFRPHRLDAVERLFLRLIVAPVIVLTLPLQWAALGAVALIAVVVNVAWAMLLVELFIRRNALMDGWLRVGGRVRRRDGADSSVRAGLRHVRTDPTIVLLLLGVAAIGVGVFLIRRLR